MTVTSALLSFALVAALMTITPGLDTALVLRTATSRGRRAAFAAAAGISLGVLVWALAGALGVSALLAASRTAYAVVRYAGAAYMVWLGIGMLRAALRRTPGDAHDATPPVRSPWASFRQGFLANLMNPKIGVFYVAMLPQFLPAGVNPGLMGAALAAIHNAEGLVWFALLILAAHRMRRLLQSPRTQRWIDGVAGTVIVGFGVKLGLSH